MLVLTAFFTSEHACALVLGPDVLGFDFRFNTPGARANRMGGTFVGLADDASAAYTTPAGLTILTEPEISVEYKMAPLPPGLRTDQENMTMTLQVAIYPLYQLCEPQGKSDHHPVQTQDDRYQQSYLLQRRPDRHRILLRS